MSKRVYRIILWAVLAVLAALFVLVYCAESDSRGMSTCSGLKVEFCDPFNFVTEDDIRACLDKGYGAYVGQRVDSVDIYRMEDMLDKQSAVLKSEVYLTPDGKLNVLIRQREPVIRFQKGNIGFYADERGYIFPLQSKYTANVPVVDGDLPIRYREGFRGEPESPEEAAWLRGVLELLDYISKSRTWSDGIVQMSVSGRDGLILVPRSGKEKFIFGYPDDIPQKFSRIEKYYQYIRPEKGAGCYSTVNVKYDGQIVCRK